MSNSVFEGEKIRIFISYSTEDAELAGQIKKYLDDCEWLDVFLAHEDISPSQEWQDFIIDKIKNCHIFIPLLTNNFETSEWTDQETGIAVSNDKTVIPIKIDTLPYGFIKKYQALKFQPNVEELCVEIHRSICEHEDGDWLINRIINSFVASESYMKAASVSKLLMNFQDLDSEQLNEIFSAFLSNAQIRDSFKAKTNLRVLYRKYKDKIDKNLQEKIEEKIWV